MIQKVLFAGFGGQGVMLMGELLAYAAMIEQREVTYMPSYGPEMRGGTANCSVVISDSQISSPIITTPTVLVAMNEPSLDKFEGSVEASGFVFINKSLSNRTTNRDDISCFDVDCNELAKAVQSEKMANMVMLGAVIKETGIVSFDAVDKAMEKKLTGGKAKFIPVNKQALLSWGKR